MLYAVFLTTLSLVAQLPTPVTPRALSKEGLAETTGSLRPSTPRYDQKMLWDLFDNLQQPTQTMKGKQKMLSTSPEMIVRPVSASTCFVQPSKQQLPWMAAEQYCTSLSGHLASVVSDLEWALFFDAFVESTVWVGAVADYTGPGEMDYSPNILISRWWSLFNRWVDGTRFVGSVVQQSANALFAKHLNQRQTKCLYKVSATSRARTSIEVDWFKADDCDVAKDFVCKVPCNVLNLGERLTDLMVKVDLQKLPYRFH